MQRPHETNSRRHQNHTPVEEKREKKTIFNCLRRTGTSDLGHCRLAQYQCILHGLHIKKLAMVPLYQG
jgi:hypothetical protein